jgi:hypothetical protein
LQELHLRIGKRSHIGVREPRTTKFDGNLSGEIRSRLPQYVLTVSEDDNLCLVKKKHIEQDKYKGEVFCVTVSNGTVVTRRNGSVMYSGNCWSYSTAACIQMIRAIANQPYVQLSAHSVACVIKNFRDQGGWGCLSLDMARDKGYVPVSLWPAKSMDKRYNTPENWKAALEFRVTEGWVDLVPSVYDRDMSAQQVGTCLLSNIPVIGDFNWWGHSVALADLVDVYPDRSPRDIKRYGTLCKNSWTDRWGNRGWGVLKDSKAWPNGGAAPRVAWGA